MSLLGWVLPPPSFVGACLRDLLAGDDDAERQWLELDGRIRGSVLAWARDGGFAKYRGRCAEIADRLRAGESLTSPPLGPSLPWPEMGGG